MAADCTFAGSCMCGGLQIRASPGQPEEWQNSRIPGSYVRHAAGQQHSGSVHGWRRIDDSHATFPNIPMSRLNMTFSASSSLVQADVRWLAGLALRGLLKSGLDKLKDGGSCCSSLHEVSLGLEGVSLPIPKPADLEQMWADDATLDLDNVLERHALQRQ